MFVRTLNRPLRRFGAEIVPAWQRQWWRCPSAFELGGRNFSYFYHCYNCGWPPYATERCAELGLADAWLNELHDTNELVEVGAVTPYYWPSRVKNVVDPFDPHKLVTLRLSLFDVDFTGKTVLSISTLEHVGLAEYGGEKSPGQAVRALRKILDESPCFLLTVPVGYNPALDGLFFENASSVTRDAQLRFLVRTADGQWREEIITSDARRPYDAPGVNHGRSASALAVLERGDLLRLGPVVGEAAGAVYAR
ncbi:MAG TPA: hypothetical protein VNH11_03985 [Pirellulales bacterium]|nr:hypothetical protein [Pirellulales bacterium]